MKGEGITFGVLLGPKQLTGKGACVQACMYSPLSQRFEESSQRYMAIEERNERWPGPMFECSFEVL